MSLPLDATHIAFEDHVRLGAGSLAEAEAAVMRRRARDGRHGALLVFDLATGRVVDPDSRRLDSSRPESRRPSATDGEGPEEPARPRGRPRLGVTAREVTLLPRHWEWLAAQPGGASVALRRLVEEARRSDDGRTDRRSAQEAANRFMTTMAGDLPRFEDATRALFANDRTRFAELTEGWPNDVRQVSRALADRAFAPPATGVLTG